MSQRRARLERKRGRAAQAARPKPVPAVRASMPQRYEVLHYLGDLTGSESLQPGRILGHDETGRPYEVIDAEFEPASAHAEGHFDGDGCTFPTEGHLLPARTTVQLQYASVDNVRAALAAAGVPS